MKQIRRGVFETNSSSTHSLVICTDKDIEMIKPATIEFTPGEFGWDDDLLNTPLEKASYLYTLILILEDEAATDAVINRLYDWLGEDGIEATFKKPSGDDYYYVDHASEAQDFYDYVVTNKRHLMKFLFSNKSFIITSNDNSGCGSGVEALAEQRSKGYSKKIFFKGN